MGAEPETFFGLVGIISPEPSKAGQIYYFNQINTTIRRYLKIIFYQDIMGEFVGAGEGNRTLVVSLGSFCSAIELHPRKIRLAAVRGHVKIPGHTSPIWASAASIAGGSASSDCRPLGRSGGASSALR